MADVTQRSERAHLPVRTIEVEVVRGPDAGVRARSDGDTLSVGTAQGNQLVLKDPTVSRFHLELSSDAAGVVVADLGSTNGTRIAEVLIERAIAPHGTEVHVGDSTIRLRAAELVDVEVRAVEASYGVFGTSPAMRKLMAKVERVAASDATVLLHGESGTGKELIARAVHEASGRADMPFVTVDCGSLQPTLVASELFGHEKGAFTGAHQRHTGAFERANGGTLFLDEIGELPAALQATLLGVLERRRFRRLGGTEEITIDTRIVSATHRELRRAVNEEKFRLDLFYRLAVVTFVIPPLRQRLDDLPALIGALARELGAEDAIRSLTGEAVLSVLRAHHWPGNVRELKNWVEAACALGEPPELYGDVERPGASDPIADKLSLPWKEARGALLHELEARYLPALLERCSGNVSEAARVARVDRNYLTTLLKRHGLK